MGNELPFETETLESMCELVIDCPHFTPKWTDSGVIVLRNQNIRNGVLNLSSPSFTNNEGYESRIKRAVPRAGDIVITREAPMGEVCIIPEGLKCCLGQRQVLLRPKKGVSSDYLFWALQSHYVKHQISWNEGTGTTVSNIRIPVLKAFKIPRWYEKENEIAHHLSTIANKINLNKQTNQTLEQMAQTLFKSWFVDFDPVFDNLLAMADFKLENLPSDFPEALLKRAELRLLALKSKEHDKTKAALTLTLKQDEQSTDSPVPLLKKTAKERAKEIAEQPQANIHKHFPSEFEHNEKLGWIPRGWEKVSFESLITLIGGGTPKTTIEEYWNGDIPWFSVVDAPNDSDVFVIDTDKHVTQLGVDKSSTKILRTGTTIISARGTVGKCALVANPMAMNQSCYGINGKHEISDEYIYFLTRYQVSGLQKRGHGSVFNTITRDTFKSIDLPFSGSKLTIEFSNIVSTLFNKILNNNKQNIELTKLRDTLLPKLISGELKIPDTADKTKPLIANEMER